MLLAKCLDSFTFYELYINAYSHIRLFVPKERDIQPIVRINIGVGEFKRRGPLTKLPNFNASLIIFAQSVAQYTFARSEP